MAGSGSSSRSPDHASTISKFVCDLQHGVHDDFYYFLNAPVDHDSLGRIQFKNLPPRPSSPDLLSCLPLEIQHEIFLLMDLDALASLRLTSYQFKSTIDEFPPYFRTQQHAPILYRLLRDSATISYHALGTIHHTLISPTCSFCGDFGPYLFVLTFQRCCANCLERNPALRLIKDGEDCDTFFGVSRDEAMKLPSISMNNFSYCSEAFGHTFSCRCRGWERRERPPDSRYFLVSQVHELGLSCHGTQEAMQFHTMRLYFGSYNLYQRQPSRAPPVYPLYVRDPTQKPDYNKNREERFFLNPLDGLAKYGATRLPVLNLHENEVEVEAGLLCVGCQIIYECWLEAEEDHQAHHNIKFVGSWAKLKPLEMRAHKAWSKEGILAHIKECEGAKKLRKHAAQRVPTGTHDLT